MKTLMQIRKRLAHLAIGPLVGAVIAGLLLIVLMLHINNGETPIGHDLGNKHAKVELPVNSIAAPVFG